LLTSKKPRKIVELASDANNAIKQVRGRERDTST